MFGVFAAESRPKVPTTTKHNNNDARRPSERCALRQKVQRCAANSCRKCSKELQKVQQRAAESAAKPTESAAKPAESAANVQFSLQNVQRQLHILQQRLQSAAPCCRFCSTLVQISPQTRRKHLRSAVNATQTICACRQRATATQRTRQVWSYRQRDKWPAILRGSVQQRWESD